MQGRTKRQNEQNMIFFSFGLFVSSSVGGGQH